MREEQVASTFSERLIEALESQGITDHKQQVEKVAQGLKVKPKTAEKYLQSATWPAFFNVNPGRIYALADDLEFNAIWLWNGDGPSPEEMRFIKAMKSWTKWEKNKYQRLMIRIINDDAKALRLFDMHIAGQISRHQLLAAM